MSLEAPRLRKMLDMQRAILKIHVGRLVCGYLRNELESLRFQGVEIEWIEGKGLLDRPFTIRAPRPVVEGIYTWLQQFSTD